MLAWIFNTSHFVTGRQVIRFGTLGPFFDKLFVEPAYLLYLAQTHSYGSR